MTYDLTITGLTRFLRPKADRNGHTTLARFECDVNGLSLSGCNLVRLKTGKLAVWLPKVTGTKDVRLGVSFRDSDLRAQMLEQACEVYKVFGGELSDGPTAESDGRTLGDILGEAIALKKAAVA